jgi:hypothetical protein
MRAVNQKAARVLNTLTKGLAVPFAEDGESSRKIDNASGSFMAVSVERIGTNLYSVAHYFEQCGDLMADPEMVFLSKGGKWYPVSIKMDALGVCREGLVLDPYTEEPTGIRRREQKDEAVFAGTWMQNIKWQQGL